MFARVLATTLITVGLGLAVCGCGGGSNPPPAQGGGANSGPNHKLPQHNAGGPKPG
jgi:hypothetical protein